MRLGTTELIVIVVIALLIFGPAKLPQLGQAVGKTLGSFKSGLKEGTEVPEEEEEEDDEDEEEEEPAPKKTKKSKKEDDEE